MSPPLAAAPVRSPEASLFSDQEIRRIASGSSSEVAAWIRTTAEKRGVSIRRLPTDTFADAVCRLSDAPVELDQVEQLLIALRRAHVISQFQRGLLQLCYLG